MLVPLIPVTVADAASAAQGTSAAAKSEETGAFAPAATGAPAVGTTIYFDNTERKWPVVYLTSVASGNHTKGTSNSAGSEEGGSGYAPKSDKWFQMTQIGTTGIYSYTFKTGDTIQSNYLSFFNTNGSNYKSLYGMEAALDVTFNPDATLYRIAIAGNSQNLSTRSTNVWQNASAWDVYGGTCERLYFDNSKTNWKTVWFGQCRTSNVNKNEESGSYVLKNDQWTQMTQLTGTNYWYVDVPAVIDGTGFTGYYMSFTNSDRRLSSDVWCHDVILHTTYSPGKNMIVPSSVSYSTSRYSGIWSSSMGSFGNGTTVLSTVTANDGFAYIQLKDSVFTSLSPDKAWYWRKGQSGKLFNLEYYKDNGEYTLYRYKYKNTDNGTNNTPGGIKVVNNTGTLGSSSEPSDTNKLTGILDMQSGGLNSQIVMVSTKSTGTQAAGTFAAFTPIPASIDKLSANSSVILGRTIDLTAVQPLSGSLIDSTSVTYSFVCTGDNIEPQYLGSVTGSDRTLVWTPSSTGTFDIYLTASDIYGLETTVIGIKTITVKPNIITVTAQNGDHGVVDPAGTTSVSVDADFTITAYPEAHYEVLTWLVGGETVASTAANQLTRKYEDPSSVVPVYTYIPFGVTISNTTGISAVFKDTLEATARSFGEPTDITITLGSPSFGHYVSVKVTNDFGAQGSTQTVYSPNENGEVTFTAYEETLIEVELFEYTVSYDTDVIGDGSVAPESGDGNMPDTFTVTATPNGNNRFLRWEYDASEIEAVSGLDTDTLVFYVLKDGAVVTAVFTTEYNVVYKYTDADGTEKFISKKIYSENHVRADDSEVLSAAILPNIHNTAYDYSWELESGAVISFDADTKTFTVAAASITKEYNILVACENDSETRTALYNDIFVLRASDFGIDESEFAQWAATDSSGNIIGLISESPVFAFRVTKDISILLIKAESDDIIEAVTRITIDSPVYERYIDGGTAKVRINMLVSAHLEKDTGYSLSNITETGIIRYLSDENGVPAGHGAYTEQDIINAVLGITAGTTLVRSQAPAGTMNAQGLYIYAATMSDTPANRSKYYTFYAYMIVDGVVYISEIPAVSDIN